MRPNAATLEMYARMTRDWHRRHPLVLTLEDHARREVETMRRGSVVDAEERNTRRARGRRRMDRASELARLDPWSGANA